MRKASIVRHDFVRTLWHLHLAATLENGVTLATVIVCTSRREANARKRVFLKGV